LEFLGLTESVVKHIRDNIITCRLIPGRKLSEMEVAASLNISRAPLREAFRLLENEHLIVRIPRRGTYVTEISAKHLREVYSAREMIECHAIDLLKAGNIRDLPEISSSLAKASYMKPPTGDDQDEIVTYLRSLTDFHVKLVASTRNSWVIHFYDSIITTLARYQYFCTRFSSLTLESRETHERVFDLLTRGSYEQAKALLVSHIKYTVGFIENYIQKEWGHRPELEVLKAETVAK
jgi:DNA-binding GntR family transcriptional regulator